MNGVLYTLSQTLGIGAFALLAPAVIGLVNGDPAGGTYLVIAGLVGFIAGATFFTLQDRVGVLDRGTGLGAVVVTWATLPLVAALPLAWATPLNGLDAVFEAASGLTTTGATTFATLEGVSAATLFWRCELQWLGGLLTLITFAGILAPLGVGGLSSRGIAAIGRREGELTRGQYLVRGITVLYLLATGLCVAALLLTGLPPFDALCLGFATVSTGGFMPRDGGLASYGSPAGNAVIVVFMIIGGTSITWHRAVVEFRHGAFSRHLESYAVIAMVAVVAIAYAASFAGNHPLGAAIGEGLFTAASLVTTTGFEIGEGALASLPGAIPVLIALAGGAALSTAGGVKLYRIGAMMLASQREFHRLVFPSGVLGIGLAGMTRDVDLMKALWANLTLSVFVVIAAAVGLSLQLPTIGAALTAAVAAFASIGPLYASMGVEQAAWPDFAAFDAVSKTVMIVTMILGRIELFAFLALIGLFADRRF